MDTKKLFKQIKKDEPNVIYLSGKTATGKTTFGNKLHSELGYDQIELDQIVMKAVVEKYRPKEDGDAFVVVYRDGEPQKWRDDFIRESKKVIQERKTGHLVIEGAIANTETLKAIFEDSRENFMFVYFQPVDRQKYIDRIKKRLVTGINRKNCSLPKSFWVFASQKEKDKYIATGKITPAIEEAINKYVDSSMRESNERLALFKKEFKDIVIVEI